MELKRKRGGQFGHSVSAETRKRMSIAARGRHYSVRTEFKPGDHSSPATEFKVGMIPYNTRASNYTFVDSHAGYRMVRSSRGKNGWAKEHTVVAENALGRRLKSGEEVHHINGDKLDNRNANLLVCSTGYHRELERRMAYLYQREHFSGALNESA